jgi:ribosomal protein S18 acetylase RimI-like enzyme
VIVLTEATIEDVPGIAALLEELDRFYGSTEFDPIQVRTAQIGRLLFGEPSAAHVLLARVDGALAGLAAFSFLWPADGVTASLYLKELYVSAGHRRAGLGRDLMTRLVEIAAERGCSRVEWTTDRDNDLAQRFYTALGFQTLSTKAFYRIPIAHT